MTADLSTSGELGEGAVGESRALKILLARFLELPLKDQLEAFATIRDYLGADLGGGTKVDEVIEERRAALEVLRRIATDLGLAEGEAPTQKQFAQRAPSVAPGWSVGRIQRAFGHWRFARDALLGRGIPPTAAQQAIRGARARVRSSEDYLTGVKEWLATEPAHETSVIYDLWRRERNERLAPGDRPVASAQGICKGLDLTWAAVVRAARGEKDPKKLERRGKRRLKPLLGGPHDLVTLGVTAQILGLSITEARRETSLSEFPAASLVHERSRAHFWYRSDVLAYKEDQPFPERRENELRDLYFDSQELSERYGLKMSAIAKGARNRPRPTLSGGNTLFWLRADVEEFDRLQAVTEASGARPAAPTSVGDGAS